MYFENTDEFMYFENNDEFMYFENTATEEMDVVFWLSCDTIKT